MKNNCRYSNIHSLTLTSLLKGDAEIRDKSLDSANYEKVYTEEAFRVTGLTFVGGGETMDDIEEIAGEHEGMETVNNAHQKNREFIIKKI